MKKLILKNQSIFAFSTYQSYLIAIYEDQKSHYKKLGKTYSYDKFCEDLGFGLSPYYYQISHSKRKLTPKSATKLAKALGLGDEESAYFILLTKFQHAKQHENRMQALKDILQIFKKKLDQQDSTFLEFISSWKNIVLREVICMTSSKGDLKALNDSLIFPVSNIQAENTLGYLQETGIIYFDFKNQKWEMRESEIKILGNHLAVFVLTFIHHQMLQLAGRALTLVAPEHRHFETVSISIKHDNIGQMKQKVAGFIDEITEEFAEKENPDQLVQCNVQLFPYLKEPVK